MMQPLFHAPLRETKQLRVFPEPFVLLARNFEHTKTPRQSFLAACDCRLAHPTPSHTPRQEQSLSVAGCGPLW